MSELYRTLEVAPDASQEDIKRAYRRLAQATHPDRKHGDAERFQKIRHAYAVLSDPELRARYDATGAESESIDTDLRNRELSLAAEATNAIMRHALESAGSPWGIQSDPVRMAMHEIEAQTIPALKRQIADIERRIASVRSIKARLRRRDPQGEDLAAVMIDTGLATIEAQRAQAEDGIRKANALLEVIGQYEWAGPPDLENVPRETEAP